MPSMSGWICDTACLRCQRASGCGFYALDVGLDLRRVEGTLSALDTIRFYYYSR